MSLQLHDWLIYFQVQLLIGSFGTGGGVSWQLVSGLISEAILCVCCFQGHSLTWRAHEHQLTSRGTGVLLHVSDKCTQGEHEEVPADGGSL